MDGHSTHMSVGLLEWAKSMNIVMHVHTSHILQPLDVACFGPFQGMYNNLCHNTMRLSCDITFVKSVVKCTTKHSVLRIWFLDLNLLEYFLKKSVISSLTTKPSVSPNNDTADDTEPTKEIQSVVQVEETNDITDLPVPEDFFDSKVDKKLNHFEIKLLITCGYS